jgi:hypothetical protein
MCLEKVDCSANWHRMGAEWLALAESIGSGRLDFLPVRFQNRPLFVPLPPAIPSGQIL